MNVYSNIKGKKYKTEMLQFGINIYIYRYNCPIEIKLN